MSGEGIFPSTDRECCWAYNEIYGGMGEKYPFYQTMKEKGV